MNNFYELIENEDTGIFHIYVNLENKKIEFSYPFENKHEIPGIIRVFDGSEYPIILEKESYKPQIIYDIGANLGASSIYFSKNYPDAQVFSFEPGKKLFTYLEKNTNEIENIRCFNYGLNDCNSETEIFIGRTQQGQNSIFQNYNTSDETEEISLKDILEVIEANKHEHINILKIDTEGAEYPILSRLIRNSKIKIDTIYLEFHSENDRLMIDQLLCENHILGFSEVRGFHRGSLIYFNKNFLSAFEDYNINEIISTASKFPLKLNNLYNFFNKVENEIYPEEESSLHSGITSNVIRNIFNQKKFSKDLKILDLGCGKGPALKIFREYGYNPIGVTASQEDVDDCKKLGFEVYKMDQSFLEFEDNSFDFIWARHILEHSFMPLYTLTEYKRVLKPGGFLYIEVPAPDTDCHHEENPNHYSVFPKDTWKQLFRKIGFQIDFTNQINLDIPEDDKIYKDAYLFFYLSKPLRETKIIKDIYLALSKGENFGWGVCSNYLRKEMPKFSKNIIPWDFETEGDAAKIVEGKVIHALTGLEFESISKLRGTENFGYTFFENELIDMSRHNAKNYDLVIGGSTWCKEKMEDFGIKNTSVLLQGIDPEIFYPIEEEKDENMFVIFSGGKFELRKSQDLVLKAVKILQQRYPDIILINAWFNMWPDSVRTMQQSKHIDMNINFSGTWQDLMKAIYHKNGLDENRIITFDLIKNTQLRELYSKTDIGLFPNRCEGGTNLVLMEYMACGKPVIVSNTSGHKDVVSDQNSLLLNDLKEYKIYSDANLWADWEEPSVDEIVDKIEFAYHNRSEIKKLGKQAGKDYAKLTWNDTAKELVKIIS